jgi:hypothetical protein
LISSSETSKVREPGIRWFGSLQSEDLIMQNEDFTWLYDQIWIRCWSIDWFIEKIYRKLRFFYGIRYPNVWETIGFLSILASFNSGNVVGSNPTCAGFKSLPHLYSGACLVAVVSLFQTRGKKGAWLRNSPKSSPTSQLVTTPSKKLLRSSLDSLYTLVYSKGPKWWPPRSSKMSQFTPSPPRYCTHHHTPLCSLTSHNFSGVSPKWCGGEWVNPHWQRIMFPLSGLQVKVSLGWDILLYRKFGYPQLGDIFNILLCHPIHRLFHLSPPSCFTLAKTVLLKSSSQLHLSIFIYNYKIIQHITYLRRGDENQPLAGLFLVLQRNVAVA